MEYPAQPGKKGPYRGPFLMVDNAYLKLNLLSILKPLAVNRMSMRERPSMAP